MLYTNVDKYVTPILLYKYNLLPKNEKEEKINKLISLYDEYDYKLGSICYLCHNIIKYHSFTHIDTQFINNIYTAVFYSVPSKAINRSPYHISRHVLMEINNTLNKLKTQFLSNDVKIKIIFNMKNTYPTINNIKITNNLYYILNNCYMDIIDSIIVINAPSLMFLFTTLFSSLFNDKIKVVKNLSDSDYNSCSQYLN